MSNWMAAQRYYSVKDEKDAKRVGLTCSILFLTVPILFGIPPLAAKLLWPDLSQIPFFQGKLVPEDLVYIGMVLKAVPNGLIGFFLAAMFAATMSALDTTYNIDSSIISKDLYGKVFKPHASEDDLLKVGKISTLFLGIMAIVMSLVYCNTTYGIFNLMVTMMSLFAMPIAIPMAFGLVFKQLPRWSAMSALILGLLTSALVRFNLEWSVGPQIYATVLTTFGVLLLAEPLGRVYRKDRFYGMATILVLVIALFSLYYTQSAADMTPMRTGLLLLAGMAFMGLLIVFSRLFARETDQERMIVEKFFQNLSIPVDVAKEVYGEGKKPVSTYPVVGLICMIIGAIIIVLLITPMSAQDRWMTFAVGALLAFIGFLLYYFGGKSERAFIEKMQKAQSSLGEGQE
jgi:Na+/proline symporter